MNFLSGNKASVVLLASMAVILGADTFVEHFVSPSLASAIYHNPITIVLWWAMIVNWFLLWQKRIKFVPVGSTLLHLAFAVMLCGAFISMTTEVDGKMCLEPGEEKGMIIQENGFPKGLPFSLRLDSLEVSRYPGSGNPSGFTSHVILKLGGAEESRTVSVNHPLRVQGWRIYQASYVPETGASVFSLAHDPWGVAVSYSGYALMLLAFIMLIFSPRSRFARLRKELSALGCVAVLALGAGPGAAAAGPDGATWERLAAQDSRGRLVPLDSYSRELMRKVHHSESLEGAEPTESLLKIMASPELVWDKPFIYQKNKELASRLSQPEGKLISLGSLFDSEGTYLLAREVSTALAVPAQQRSNFQKDVLKLDEKANLVYALLEGRELPVFPVSGDAQAAWLSPGDDLSGLSAGDSLAVRSVLGLLMEGRGGEAASAVAEFQRTRSELALPSGAKLSQELLSNRIKPFKRCAMGYMFCAILLIVLSLVVRKGRIASGVILAASLLVFLLHSWGIGARWFCSGQVPMSNAYEATVLLSWCMALISLVASRRSASSAAFGLLFSGALLLVAGMNNMDPAVTPLVPVLQSPWLMFHVAVIIAGYACFGINFLLSVYNLAAMAFSGRDSLTVQKTTILVEMFAQVGLMLMTVGTFLGAVWAGESWGTYWSWDPKETWALVTVLVYSVCTHARLVPKLNNPKWLSIFSILGFACVLMTYFGVNYFLVGMHSYAG